MSLLVLLSLALQGHAVDVELRLRDKTVQGELIAEHKDRLVIRQRFMLRGEVRQADLDVSREAIISRQNVASPAEMYTKRCAETAPDPVAQCKLAQWCLEQCLPEQAGKHALAALASDAEMAWPRRILANCGMIELDGRWVGEREHLASLGQARFEDRIVPISMLKDLNALRTAVGVREIVAVMLKRTEAEAAKDEDAAAHRAEARATVELLPAMDEVRELQGRIDALMGMCEADERLQTGNEKNKQILAIVGRIQKQQADMLKDMEKDLTKPPTRAVDPKQAAARRERRRQAVADARGELADARKQVEVCAARLPAEDPTVRAALAGNSESPVGARREGVSR
jgi:hypothetical protein